jgi:glutamyl-tRNA(Gln) amidotransferase subunit E
LATSQKLFCACRAEFSTLDPEITFYRRLRPAQSEFGEVDPAAAFEFAKGRRFLYEADREVTCLVEMDEEPPHRLNEEAVDICLTVALMADATPVDEIHVMRKIVIDGSNTTGFQRTCIIALGGEIEVDDIKVQLQTLCLEEDAARKTGEDELTTRYQLDRLCIPLIEIATAPVIYTPKDAQDVALALGRVLRDSKRVKRGLGTIRQDINVSIKEGALTEIKGVQSLGLVSTVVALEVQRQVALLKIRDELARRGARREDLSKDFVDVTSVFNGTRCNVIEQAVQNGERVLAVTLPNFRGLLGSELIPGLRFGTELADYAKFWGRVGGIFHTDELPAYGITLEELDELKQTLRIGEDDAIVFLAAEEENTIDALHAVVGRAKQAVEGVPNETRGANPDGITHYSRPRPGAARMYPETDVPPLPISREYLALLKEKLPESRALKLSRLMKLYSLNDKLASQLVDSEYDAVFERVADDTSLATSFLAATLTETLKSLRREGFDVEPFSEDMLLKLFKSVDEGVIAKEAIPDVLKWLGSHEGAEIRDALEALGLSMISIAEVETIVNQLVQENEDLIRQRGLSALSPLMGVIMKTYRGRVDAKKVSQILREKIASR